MTLERNDIGDVKEMCETPPRRKGIKGKGDKWANTPLEFHQIFNWFSWFFLKLRPNGGFPDERQKCSSFKFWKIFIFIPKLFNLEKFSGVQGIAGSSLPNQGRSALQSKPRTLKRFFVYDIVMRLITSEFRDSNYKDEILINVLYLKGRIPGSPRSPIGPLGPENPASPFLPSGHSIQLGAGCPISPAGPTNTH